MSEYNAELPDFSKYIIGYPINPNNITRQEVINHRHRLLKDIQEKGHDRKESWLNDREKLVYEFVMNVQCSYDNVMRQDKDPKEPRRICHDCMQLHNGISGGDCLECAWEQFQPYWEHKKNHTYHSKESYFMIMCEHAEQYHLDEVAKQQAEKKKREERKAKGLPEWDYRDDLRVSFRVDEPKDMRMKWVSMREIKDNV